MIEFLRRVDLLDDAGYIRIPENINRIKIDVGLSENAPMSSVWLKESKDLMVFGFEPSRKNLDTLKEGNSKFPVKIDPSLIGNRMILFPVALGMKRFEPRPWKRKFYSTSLDGGQSSFFAPKDFLVDDEYDVEVWSLDEFIELIPPERFPLIEHIKTDCQSGDFDILFDLRPENISRIIAYTLEIETQQYEGISYRRKDVDNFFKRNGFIHLNIFLRLLLRWKCRVSDPTFINRANFWRLLSCSRIWQKG